MNLIHLHEKSDPILKLGEGVTRRRFTIAGRTYEGFVLPGGPSGELRLRSALRWHPFASRPLLTDWLAVAVPKYAPWAGLMRLMRLRQENRDRGHNLVVELEVALVHRSGQTVARGIDWIGAGPSVVSFPRLAGPSTLDADRSLDLVLRNRSEDDSAIMLLVMESDSSKRFNALATGTGIELLSGPSMSLAATRNRDLFYVGSEAQILASKSASQSHGHAWGQPLIGSPHDIPVVDHALDFIFAGNILHRAVNPLGHLGRWRTKLRPGGRVLGIVPYVAGGSDYLNAPTTMDNWVDQYKEGGFEETQAHHNAYARARDLNPKSLFRRGHPSSFSFFTPANVSDMLGFAIDRFGYEGMHIEHARNARQIRFGLYV